MDLRDALRSTLFHFRAHKLRSLLATIGVTLGIAAVIGVVTLGAGFESVITDTLTGQSDPTSLTVEARAKTEAGGFAPPPPTGSSTTRPFTDRDVAAVRALPGVASVTASVQLPVAEVAQDGRSLPGLSVMAVDGPSTSALEEGRAPGRGEAIVSSVAAERLQEELGVASVLGIALQVGTPEGETRSYTVVGVQVASMFGSSERILVDDALVPLVEGTRQWQSLVVRATGVDEVGSVSMALRTYLDGESDARARIGPREELAIDTQDALAESIRGTTSQFTVFIGAIGGISLLVGLVGITNIMLVSVSERTREVGVMKALGARRRDILLLFLLDAVAICVLGAALGVALGAAFGASLGALVGGAGSGALPFVVLPGWYAIAIGLGVLTGVLAGIYPAWRAASVSPVQALRYE